MSRYNGEFVTNVTDVTSEKIEKEGEKTVTNEIYRNVTNVTEIYQNVAEFLNLIQKTFNLTRTVEALPYFVLWRHGRLSLSKLKELMEEYNRELGYSASSLRVALSLLRKDKVHVLEIKDKELGITYYELKEEAKEEIVRMFELQVKLEELEEDGSKDDEELVKKAYMFLKEYYRDRIIELFTVKSQEFLVIDWLELNSLAPQLAEVVIEKPLTAVRAFEKATVLFQQEEMFEKDVETIRIHFSNVLEKLKPSDIRAKHVGRLVEVKGLVVGVSNVSSFYSKAVFVCKDCGERFVRLQMPLRPLAKPKRCEVCGSRNLELFEEESEKFDFQYFEIQDSPEDAEGGEPRKVSAYVIGEQAGSLKSGMRVKLTAVVRERIFKKDQYPVFERVLEVNHVEVLDKAMSVEELNEEDKSRILNLAKEHGYDLPFVVASNIAPHLYGLEKEKLGACVALVGGVPSSAKARPHINVLYIGDPGCGKTELLRAIEKVAPKAIFASGGGSTAVGLTATVRRNELNRGDWIVVGGALVLASGGVCLIDEFEKMSPDERKKLHTAMEQQIIPINKAGVNVTLKIDTTIIATANPMAGRFDRNKLVIVQIDLPPTLLSRFDLVFVVFDDYQDKNEILDYILEVNEQGVVSRIDCELLRKFFVYARSLKPKFNQDAKREIKEAFKALRQKYKNSRIPLNARYFNALIRIAEAFAKLRLSEVVEPIDVQRAVDLFEYSIGMIAYDPENEIVDVSILEAGFSTKTLTLVEKLTEFLKTFGGMYPNGVSFGLIVKAMEEAGFSVEQVKQVLSKLKVEEKVVEVENGYYRLAM